jgi:hypothetical protein
MLVKTVVCGHSTRAGANTTVLLVAHGPDKVS